MCPAQKGLRPLTTDSPARRGYPVIPLVGRVHYAHTRGRDEADDGARKWNQCAFRLCRLKALTALMFPSIPPLKLRATLASPRLLLLHGRMVIDDAPLADPKCCKALSLPL